MDPPSLDPSPPDAAPQPSNEAVVWWIVLFGCGIAILALMVLSEVGFALAVNSWLAPPPQPTHLVAPSPPRWSLRLPANLSSASIDELFTQGQHKMRDRDHRGALVDFYRVKVTDPGYPYVDKFAFAVGEYLVLDTLQIEMERRAVELERAEAVRD